MFCITQMRNKSYALSKSGSWIFVTIDNIRLFRYQTTWRVLTKEGKKPFENTLVKGENAGNHISP